MPADTPLSRAHDLAQQLQDKVEVLPNVGRAFVHIDHETTHKPVSLYTTLYCITTKNERILMDLNRNTEKCNDNDLNIRIVV